MPGRPITVACGTLRWATRRNFQTARGFYEKSTELDPNFASAYAALSRITMLSAYTFHTSNLAEAAEIGERLALKALALDPDDAAAHVGLALAQYYRGDLEGSILNCDNAVRSMAT